MFKLLKTDAETRARLGRLTTSHGEIETPAFMPVGTQGTVKTLDPRELQETGAQIILSNTYHLFIRPGMEILARAGGLHNFMGWKGPILTDSGGYQVFSLAQIRKIKAHGVEFRSHVDGAPLFFGPKEVMQIQSVLASDIAMVFDDCPIGKIGAGVRLQEMPEELKSRVQYGSGEALVNAVVKTWDMSTLTLRMLGKMVVGDISLSNLSGPLSIARYAGYSASIGFISFLTFLAVVSISLGVLNLLPVPMLDGGHLLYYLVEFIKGSPVSEAIQVMGQKIGVAMLLGMMLLAFYNDILRFFVK